MEEWRKDYTTVCPNSAIGNKPRISFEAEMAIME
jgi:hypothetical protein